MLQRPSHGGKINHYLFGGGNAIALFRLKFYLEGPVGFV
jgi:hypothetical protein